jgi:hypothetical protein
MACYRCRMRCIEFFPNANQESPLIRMIHALRALDILGEVPPTGNACHLELIAAVLVFFVSNTHHLKLGRDIEDTNSNSSTSRKNDASVPLRYRKRCLALYGNLESPFIKHCLLHRPGPC